MSYTQRQATELYADGYRSLAIVLVHSYTDPDHEKAIGPDLLGYASVLLRVASKLSLPSPFSSCGNISKVTIVLGIWVLRMTKL